MSSSLVSYIDVLAHFEGVWAGFREREGSIFSNRQHFALCTGVALGLGRLCSKNVLIIMLQFLA